MIETVTVEVVIRMVLFTFQTENSIFRHRTDSAINNDFFVKSGRRKSQVKHQNNFMKNILLVLKRIIRYYYFNSAY